MALCLSSCFASAKSKSWLLVILLSFPRYITNEEDKVIDLQGGRMTATVIVRWPAVTEGPVPPSSLAARTDPNIVRMPWSGTV
eukprot:COSAG01_NODE_14182_length_1486_cov_2.565970_3_plen_83_part_00